MRRSLALSAAICVGLMAAPAVAGTVKNLTHVAPDGVIFALLLTDGRVLAAGGGQTDFWTLTPDNTGSYVNGTWKQVGSLPSGFAPYASAESVLPGGHAILAGGEYNFGNFSFTNKSALYDPATDKWTDVTPPKKLLPFIGDSPSHVLPDGRFLIAEKFKEKLFAFDEKTLAWSELQSKNKHDFNAEEGWVLLKDGSFLIVDVKDHPNSERYIPSKGEWVDAGSTLVDLRAAQDCCGNCIPYGPKGKCYDPPGEIGGATLRPDGTVFATGGIPDGQSIAHTSIYTPPSKNDPAGHWTAGPDFPSGDQAFDSPVTSLINGNILVEGSSCELYEFDGTNLVREANGGCNSLLNLPTGEVLLGGQAVYQPTGTYNAKWAPTITDSPASVTRGQTYQITGTQFNGLSQGSSEGDEFDAHTNYPLVRITNTSTGHVFYAKTHDHSTMAVQTGKKPVSTSFDVPSGMETGASKIEVVANGIPSKAADITVN
jgi:hypothetical protein